MYGLIVENQAYEHMMIIRHIQWTYRYTIIYIKAWRVKQKVSKMRFDT
jgi:hypothetical protein